MNGIRLIVKVGDSSDIAFRDTVCYRAITVNELEYLSNNMNSNIIVIEQIQENENTEIKRVLREFLNKASNRVLVYSRDNDENTCGIADELNLDIYLTLADLQKAVESITGQLVSTDMDYIKEYIDARNRVEDIGENDDSIFDTGIDIIDNPDDTVEKGVPIDTNEAIIETTTSEEENSQEQKDQKISVEMENKDSLSDESNINNKDTEEKVGRGNNKKLEQTIKDNLIRINELIDLKNAIESERDMYKNMLDQINQSEEVIEEPIGLDEYKDIQDKLEQAEKKVENLQSLLDTQKLESDKLVKLGSEEWKNKYEAVMNELDGTTISELKHSITEWRQEVEKLTVELEEIKRNKEILSTENSEMSAKVSLLELKLSESETYESRIKELEDSIDKLENEISHLKSVVDIEKHGRLRMMQALNNAVSEISEKEKELINRDNENSRLNETCERLENTRLTNEEKINKLSEKNTELSDLCADTDKRIDLAKQFIQSKLDIANNENIALKSKLELIMNQLKSKEMQYNSLSMAVGLDENGVNTVLENVKNVEAFNAKLREQIQALTNENEAIVKEKKQHEFSLKRLEKETDVLREKVKIMTSSSGAMGSFTMPQITFSGKGIVIPVFGSGSFGITTTAMSLANRLSTQARVIYIDFDMVMPKADGWFSKQPIIKSIPDLKADLRATGMGILVNKGFQYWLDKVSNIIINCKVTKGGLIDYVSGFYTRPDVVRLISADFSSFLTYCANNYGYVIIDFGKIGASDISDKLIKVFTDAAYRSIFVSKNNPFEINISFTKLKEAGIDVSNVGWLLNMSLDTKVDKVKQIVESSHNYSFVPFVDSMYSTNSDFTANKMARDKFGLFVDELMKD